jgi:hypothetical protein
MRRLSAYVGQGIVSLDVTAMVRPTMSTSKSKDLAEKSMRHCVLCSCELPSTQLFGMAASEMYDVLLLL